MNGYFLTEYMEDLNIFFCWDQSCSHHRLRGKGNIFIRAKYGKHKDIRLLSCRDCGNRFSERRGTVLSNSRLPENVTLSILGHFVEGVSIRQTERYTKSSRATVRRLRALLSKLSDTPMGELLHDGIEDCHDG